MALHLTKAKVGGSLIDKRAIAWGVFLGKLSGWRSRRVQASWLRVVTVVSTTLLLTACASNSYMGISLTPGRTPPEILQLARRAQSGDKKAQLDLGIRFEDGAGLVRNNSHALQLYRQAASDSGGTIWVYSPSPGNGAPHRVIPVDKLPRQAGLVEAARRYKLIAGEK